jgi:hypothetical protein
MHSPRRLGGPCDKQAALEDDDMTASEILEGAEKGWLEAKRGVKF